MAEILHAFSLALELPGFPIMLTGIIGIHPVTQCLLFIFFLENSEELLCLTSDCGRLVITLTSIIDARRRQCTLKAYRLNSIGKR